MPATRVRGAACGSCCVGWAVGQLKP